MKDLILWLYGNEQFRYLLALVIANLVLGVFGALVARDFHFAALGDWLYKRVIPLLLGYGAAGIVALAQPDWAPVRDAAFWSLVLVLGSYILANLKGLGVPVPDMFAGNKWKD